MEQLKPIEEMEQVFAARGLPYWLFGGWAVDFHAGRVTRQHGDIDVAVWLSDLDRAQAGLEDAGWRMVSDELADGYVTLERGGVRTEVAVLARDDDGAICTPVAGGRGDWPLDSFGPDVATLDGVTARVVSLASLILDKAQAKGDESAAKDAADVAVLRALP